MISFKFELGGQHVEATTENSSDIAEIVSAIGKIADPRIKVLEKARAAKAAKRAVGVKVVPTTVRRNGHAPRAWQRWTMAEVRELNANKHLSVSELRKLPLLAGRHPHTISSMRGCLRNNNFDYAPTNFEKFGRAVLAEEAAA